MSKKKRNISLETTRFQGLTTLKFRERRSQRARETEGEWKGVFFLLFLTVCRNGEIKLETVLGRTGNNGTRSTSPSRSNSRNIKLLPFISVEFYPVRHQIAREKKEAVQFLAFGRHGIVERSRLGRVKRVKNSCTRFDKMEKWSDPTCNPPRLLNADKEVSRVSLNAL